MPAARPVVIKLDPSIHARLRELAKAQGRSTAYLMREAIIQYVGRETLRQDALRAWKTYQLTSRHVTHAEADTWLARFEAGRDLEPPDCLE